MVSAGNYTVSLKNIKQPFDKMKLKLSHFTDKNGLFKCKPKRVEPVFFNKKTSLNRLA